MTVIVSMLHQIVAHFLFLYYTYITISPFITYFLKIRFDFLVKKISGFGEKNSNLVFSFSLFNVKAGLNINFDGQVAISRLPAEHKNFPNNSSTGFVQTFSQIYSIFNFPFVLDSLTQTNQNHNLKKNGIS